MIGYFKCAAFRPWTLCVAKCTSFKRTRALLGSLIKPDKDESRGNVLGGDLCTQRRGCPRTRASLLLLLLLLRSSRFAPSKAARIDSAQVTVRKRTLAPTYAGCARESRSGLTRREITGYARYLDERSSVPDKVRKARRLA